VSSLETHSAVNNQLVDARCIDQHNGLHLVRFTRVTSDE